MFGASAPRSRTRRRETAFFVQDLTRARLRGVPSLSLARTPRHAQPPTTIIMNLSRARLALFFVLCCVLAALAPASALPTAASAPRRANRRLLVTKETSLAVDPVGAVRSVTLTNGVSFNFFCEFVKPMLDFELPPQYCGGGR